MRGFVNIPKLKKYVTVPAFIFDDNRLSIGAKGLYVQLLYSTNTVSSLDEVAELTASTAEEVKTYFNELATVGYVTVKDGMCSLNEKTQSEKTVAKKLDTTAVEEFAETKKAKDESMHTRVVELITSYALDARLTNMLIEYFDNWIFRKGRYEEAYKLTITKARELINELIGFGMTVDEMIQCVQLSIKKEYYQFVDDRATSEETKPEIPPDVKIAKITGIITTKYQFAPAVNTVLIEYFTKRVNKEGRFAEADELHGKDVHSMLMTLKSFSMTEDEQISCVRNCITNEYFKFFDNRTSATNTNANTTGIVTPVRSFKPFDKSTLTSGSYTDEDIRKLKEQAAAAGEEGLI